MSNGQQLVLGQQLTGGPWYAGQPAAPQGKNPKSQVMEFFQKRQGTPMFTTSALSKPPADPSFRCVLVCPPVQSPMEREKVIPETAFEGNGRSKKVAEQAACNAALDFYRLKRLIGNLNVVPNPPPPIASTPAAAEPRHVYVAHSPPLPVAPSPLPVDIYAQPMMTGQAPSPPPGVPVGTGYGHNMMTSPSPVPSVPSVRDAYIHPVIQNGGMYGQEHTIVRQEFPYAQPQPEPSNHAQIASNGQDSARVMSRSEFAQSDEEAEYDVDNSDLEQRKHEASSCMDVRRLKEMAFEALDEIMALRSELFEAQKRNETKRKIAEKIKEEVMQMLQN